MPALAGFNGSVLLTSTPNTALTNEVLTDSGDHQTFNISSSSWSTKRYWDRTTSFTVQTSTNGGSSWSTAAAGTYTIRYVTGQVVLASALSGTPGCRIQSGAYLPFSTLGNAKSWEATPTVDLADITAFGDQWKDYQPTLVGCEVKLDQFYADSSFFTLLTSGSSSNLAIISGFTGRNATERYEGYSMLKGTDIKQMVNAVVEESLTLTIDGQFYYFAGQTS